MAYKTLSMPSTYIEAAATFAFGGLLRFLPLSLSARLGEALFRIICVASHREKAFVKSQMRTTFTDKYSEEEYEKLADGFFRHIGCLLAEAVRLKTLTVENVDSYVDWDVSHLLQILAPSKERGLGAFMTTGHIGNWEFTGAASALKGLLVASIARPIDNPLVNRVIDSYRQNSGQKIWAKQGAVTNMLRAIKKGESVGILVDQDAGNDGLQIPFLGRPASTVTALADLSLRCGAPIFPAAIQRVDNKPMNFRINTREMIFPDKTTNVQQERIRILTQMNDALSSIIMDAPEQWLWTHRRWKTPNPTGGNKK